MMTARRYDTIAELLPDTIATAAAMPPICDMMRDIPAIHIQRTVEVLLAQLAGRITTGGNLTQDLVQFIARQLIARFPAETLADFKICFERGAMGAYGALFRLDGAIIGEWMGKYLSEKYEAVERTYEAQKARERDAPIAPPDEGPGYAEFQAWAKRLAAEMNRPADVADDLPGRRTEKARGTGYALTPAEIAAIDAEQEARLIEGRRRYWREKYPNASDSDIEALVNRNPSKPK